MNKRGILLVDDHELFRDGLKYLIERIDGYYVLDEAANGQQYLELLNHSMPDLVLMDISMPIMNGIEATKKSIRQFPELKIIALSMYTDDMYYHQMIDAGARGFVLKDSGKTEFRQALDTVCRGGNYFSQELLCKIIDKLRNTSQANSATPANIDKLTERELQVLHLVCTGLSNTEIAEQMFLSVKTIEGHKTKLLQKTGVKNTAGLVMHAIKEKLIRI